VTAIVSPIATGGGGGGGTANAQNIRGQTTGLAPAATATLASTVAGSRKLRGLKVHGTVDGEAWIEVDGNELFGTRERISRVMNAYAIFPNPEVVSAGSTIALRVTNTSSVAGDFAGTLFAE